MSEFDSSITAYFGGDTEGLSRAAAQAKTIALDLETRFGEMGIALGDAPKKLAEESAKAFQGVFAEQEKWAQEWDALKSKQSNDEMDRIQKSAKASAEVFTAMAGYEEELGKLKFNRLSSEDKLKAVQAQALGILGQMSEVEAGSVQHAQLQLEFEKKKGQIFDLNAKVVSESLAANKGNTEEARSQVKEYTGINGVIEGTKKALKDVGVSIQGAGMGVLFASILNFAKQAINEAQKQRDAFDEMRKPLEMGKRSLADFGDALDGIKKAGTTVVGTIVSGWTMIGDLLGSSINRLRGISEAQEKVGAEVEKGRIAQEKKALALKMEQHDTEKVREAAKALAEAQKEAAFDRLNEAGRINALIGENLKLQEQIKNTEKDTVAYFERKKALLENTTELSKATVEYVKRTAELELQQVQMHAPLAITQKERMAVLQREQAILMKELMGLNRGSAEYEEVQNQLRAKGVEIIQAQREHKAALGLEHAAQLEMARLELKGVGNLTDAERARYDVLKLQVKEKQVQHEIDELLQKRLVATLNPEEEKRLKLLMKQDAVLEKQIAAKQALIDKGPDLVATEEAVTSEMEKQIQKIHERERLEAERMNRIKRVGTEPEDLTDLQLVGQKERLAKQLRDFQQDDQVTRLSLGWWDYKSPLTLAAEGEMKRITDEEKLRDKFKRTLMQPGGMYHAQLQFAPQEYNRLSAMYGSQLEKNTVAINKIFTLLNDAFGK